MRCKSLRLRKKTIGIEKAGLFQKKKTRQIFVFIQPPQGSFASFRSRNGLNFATHAPLLLWLSIILSDSLTGWVLTFAWNFGLLKFDRKFETCKFPAFSLTDPCGCKSSFWQIRRDYYSESDWIAHCTVIFGAGLLKKLVKSSFCQIHRSKGVCAAQ